MLLRPAVTHQTLCSGRWHWHGRCCIGTRWVLNCSFELNSHQLWLARSGHHSSLATRRPPRRPVRHAITRYTRFCCFSARSGGRGLPNQPSVKAARRCPRQPLRRLSLVERLPADENGVALVLGDHVSQPCQAPQFSAQQHWQRYEQRPTKRIVVLLMVLALLATRCADATTPAPQRAALVDLWNGVTGLSSACPDWASGDPCSNGWSTVACSSAPVAVTYVVVGDS